MSRGGPKLLDKEWLLCGYGRIKKEKWPIRSYLVLHIFALFLVSQYFDRYSLSDRGSGWGCALSDYCQHLSSYCTNSLNILKKTV
jgi:hypothetical protein